MTLDLSSIAVVVSSISIWGSSSLSASLAWNLTRAATPEMVYSFAPSEDTTLQGAKPSRSSLSFTESVGLAKVPDKITELINFL